MASFGDHVTLVDMSAVNLRRALHLVAWLEGGPKARTRARTVAQERSGCRTYRVR